MNSLSRRDFATAGLAAMASSALPAFSWARAPNLTTRAPLFYTFGLGDMQLTVVSDGPIPIGDVSKVVPGTPKDEVVKALEPHFLSADAVSLQQNALIVNMGEKLVLIDTGVGALKMFGESTGRLTGNLAAAGLKPEDFDAVLISHAHTDHLGGLITADGKPAFPNAEVHITKADHDYWSDETKAPNDQMKPFFTAAKERLLACKDQLKFIEPGRDVLPGITALAAPGHTVGHVVFMLTSGGKSLCNTADIAHHHVLMLEKPAIEFAYDTDPKQGAATRAKIFDMLAKDGIPMLGYHFPWPGLGHVSRKGDAFEYHPELIDTMPLETKKN